MTKQKYTPDLSARPDAPLEDSIRSFRSKIRLFALLGILFAAIGFILCALSVWVIGVVLLIVGGIFLVKKGTYEIALRTLISSNIVKQAMGDVLEITAFQGGGRLPDRHICSGMLGLSDHNTTEGSDYLKGIYHGKTVEMSDLSLVKQEITYDDDGNEQKNTYTIFKGLWAVCDLGHPLPTELRLLERAKLGQLLSKKGLKTSNEAFNKQFYIDASDDAKALQFLTPRLMDTILEMDKTLGGTTRICFTQSGRVYITSHTGKDAFAVKKRDKDLDVLRLKFAAKVRAILSPIDTLLHAETE